MASATANPNRLQIAAKIHFFLMRELGQGIDLPRMLASERYARDVLLVCEACRGTELEALARHYRAAATPQAAEPGHARKPMDWAADTSGFGVADAEAPAAPARRSWFARLTSR